MKTIRSEHIRVTRRNRECYNCGMNIKRGERYLNREIRYDGRIITLSFCLSDTCSFIMTIKDGVKDKQNTEQQMWRDIQEEER